MSSISFSYENPLKSRFGESFFKELPKTPAVYFFLDGNRSPLYIGKAENLKKRLMSYQAAKPGQAPEHILEMIEHAAEIRWEPQETGEVALRREGELIQVIRPPYNIAGTDPVGYLFLGFKSPEARRERDGQVRLDFRLSRIELGREFETYGCFRHRGKAKAGYTALLRLFYAATCERERFHLPAKICRSSPPYLYQTDIPAPWLAPFRAFMGGEDLGLLRHLMDRLLAKPNLPKQLYAPLHRDFQVAKDFFESGPAEIQRLLRRARVKKSYLTREQMDRILERDYRRQIGVAAT